MKKFLSLVLALVMTMSLVTVSAGAKDFKDDDKVTYDEAVAVMSEVKVLDGYADGSFNPQGELTRGAAAKIICNLMLGPTTAAELHADTAPFKDVPVNHTFAGYIAYCAKEGIISGYADGAFRPSAPLTGYAFMKMLLGALGYDAEIEQYTGANWSINVAKRALNIGLNKSLEGDFNGIKHVTREEAALYAFNTLKADLVEYDSRTSVNVGGAEVVIAGSEAKAQKWNNSATKIENIKKDNYIQFAEQYFTKLTLDNDVDVFGRPARTWEYKGEEIGTYVNTDLMEKEFTVEVSGKDLYDVLGKSAIEDYDLTVTIDGETDSKVLDEAYFTAKDLNKNNKDGVGATGDGVLTQVFMDADAKEIYVAIINTYLAKATTDYSEKKDEVSFDVFGLSDSKKPGAYVKTLTENVEDKEGFKVDGEDFAVAADVAEDDIYLVTVADGEIQTLVKAEVVEDTEINAFKVGSSVTVGGEKYSYADTAEYDVEVLDQYTTVDKINLKDLTYNVYLDQYGYLIGIELVEEADNYVFITGIDESYSNLSNKDVDAAAIFTDGTMKTIKAKAAKNTELNEGATVNSWFTYTVNKDGVYTLKEVADEIDVDDGVKVAQNKDQSYNTTIDKKHISLPGGGADNYKKVYGNDASIYLTVSVDLINKGKTGEAIIIDDVDSVTTGIKNVNIDPWNLADVKDEIKGEDERIAAEDVSAGVYPLYKNNGYIIAAVVVGEDDAASKNLVYAHTSKVEMESYDKSADEWTWTRKVVLNGEEVEIKEVSDNLEYLDSMDQYKWYEVKFNAEDEVINVQPVSDALTLNKDYVTDIKKLETAINEEDTVLYTQGFKKDHPEMKGSTLFVTTKDNTGFFVDENVKITLIQWNKNKLTTSFETGVKELEDIVNDLNEKNNKFDYEVSAIIEDGAATSVVIYDKTNSYEKPDSKPESTEGVDLSDPDAVTISYYGKDNEPALEDALVSIEEAIEENGYTVTEKKVDDVDEDKYIFVAKNNKTGFEKKFIFDSSTGIIELFKVTVVADDEVGALIDADTLKAKGLTEVYVADGETIKVVLEHQTSKFSSSFNGSADVTEAPDDATCSVSVSAVKSNGDKTLTYTITVDIDADCTVAIGK